MCNITFYIYPLLVDEIKFFNLHYNLFTYSFKNGYYSYEKDDLIYIYMKYLDTEKFLRALVVVTALIISLLIGLWISLNFIVDPIVYWIASTEAARIFLGLVLSWLGVSKLFDIYYWNYKRRKKNKKFNALNVPYPRTFRGRK